jgi:Putative transposase of IS4/5 family (DUF4096)
MQPHHKNYSFAVFPFLKTRGAVSIGHLTSRSTDTTDDLSAEQATCMNEIASMLFLQDNLRIRSASYAVVPFIDRNIGSSEGMEPRQPYPTDVSDQAGELIPPYVPETTGGGRAEKYPKREMRKAIFALGRGGWAWRLLPHDFPPWQMVYHDL